MSALFVSNELINRTLTIPIMVLVPSKLELVQMLRKIMDQSSNQVIEQSIRINYPRQFKFKTISHDESNKGTVLCATERIIKRNVRVDDKEYTANLTQIIPGVCSEGEITDISISHKVGYYLSQYPDWVLDIDVCKLIRNPHEFTTRLQEYKNNLLKNYKDFETELDDTAYDMISASLHFIGDSLSKSDASDVIKYVVQMIAPSAQRNAYQQFMYSIAKEIYRDSTIADKFREKSGFKQLTPSAVELSRTIYFKDILPEIDTFYITDKIDGQRAILQIAEYFKLSGSKKIAIGTEIVSLSSELTVIQPFTKKSNSRLEVVRTILDTEMVVEDGKPTFHMFDIIMSRGKRLSNLPFKMRIKEFASADKILQKYNLGSVKTFVKLTKDQYKTQLEDFYKKALASKYEIDGIIFTPEGLHYKEANARYKRSDPQSRRNTEYYNTISFKWKPVEQSTIDFYLMLIDPTHAKALRKSAGMITNSSENTYALCSGVDILTFKRLNLQFFDGYVAPESENSFQYFPIQFAPYDNPHIYLWSSSDANLGGRVAEFKFVASDGSILTRPEIVRMRDDRSDDVRKGEYFGNALRYAELIWHSIKHPLTFEMLGLSPSDLGGYFASTSDSEYFAQRAFNSYTKQELMKTYLEPPSLVDIMCGKGQDMARAIDSGFTEITMIDKDIDALYELLQRKYDLRLKTKDASAQIHIRQVDFEHAYEDIIAHTELPTQANAAMLNFGIHYLAHDKTGHNKNLPIADLFKLVSHMIKAGGRFLITCFNGQAIFDLLKKTEEWTTPDHKYSIKKAYSSKELASLNQPIDVVLPFSGGMYYREYLVNMDFLTALAADHGFAVVATDSFAAMLRAFKKHNPKVYGQLSDADKEYSGLYSYVVFEKRA